jgi:dihydroxy-acid dehydratase
MLVSDEELARRRAAWTPSMPESQTPWQELQRRFVGQLSDGGCLDFAVSYQRIATTRGLPRDNH